ncbi:MAG: hypothetical protein CMH30_04705 [Micavibrio sp.]|nr:hypothetical protein [Micavibrio sp.]
MLKYQKIIVASIIAAVIFALLYTVLLFSWLVPADVPITVEHRVELAIKCLLVPVFMLFLGIAAIANARFFSKAANPIDCEVSNQKMKVDLHYLTNTQEQLLLMSITMLGLSVYLPPHYLMLLPIYSSLFVIGRICFWIGYRINPYYRAFGFALTAYPTFAGIFYNLYALIISSFA